MPPCHPFRPVPGQCGPNRRGPLPAPPFDPRDYWATRKFVSSLFEALETKLDNLDEFYKIDVVDPGPAAEAGQAADAKSTYEELSRILAKLVKKADKATTLAGYGITDAAAKTEIAAKADLVDGKVPAAQLPSYVDDVLEYDTMSAFPATGESGKIYVAKDANKTYRWSGTQYVEISPLPVLDDEVTEASANGVKSSGIWSWVKSLIPHWLTSDYAEPATVESVATKADKTALDDKRDLDDLAVYEKVGVGDDWVWTSDDPDLLNALETNGIKPKRVDDDVVGYHFWYTSSAFGDWSHAGEWDPSYGVDAHIVKFKYENPVLSKFNVTATATRAYKFSHVSPADYLAKVSQLPTEDEKAEWNGKLDKTASGEGYLGSISWKDEHTLRTEQAGIEINGGNLDVHGFIKADLWSDFSVSNDIGGNLPAYLDSIAWRTTGGRTLSDYGIEDGATKASLAPEYSATSAYSVGAIVYYGGNIYQCKTAIPEGGEAWNAEHWELMKLFDFFTNSNSLLTGTIDDRLPIPISAKSAGFTTESYKRFVVTVGGDMTVTLHTPARGDAEIFECRFNGTGLDADASITFAGAAAITMDANCGIVTAGKVALMSAFWNGATWDVNWKVGG